MTGGGRGELGVGYAATAAPVAFPGGRGWVAKPKMSALISMQLGSYHTAAAACTHSYSTQTASSCVSSLPPSFCVHTYYYYCGLLLFLPQIHIVPVSV